MSKKYSPDDIRELAQTALVEVCKAPKTPAAARAQAARTLLEMTGAIGRHAKPAEDEDAKDLATMSKDEMLAALAEMRRNRSTPTS